MHSPACWLWLGQTLSTISTGPASEDRCRERGRAEEGQGHLDSGRGRHEGRLRQDQRGLQREEHSRLALKRLQTISSFKILRSECDKLFASLKYRAHQTFNQTFSWSLLLIKPAATWFMIQIRDYCGILAFLLRLSWKSKVYLSFSSTF